MINGWIIRIVIIIQSQAVGLRRIRLGLLEGIVICMGMY